MSGQVWPPIPVRGQRLPDNKVGAHYLADLLRATPNPSRLRKSFLENDSPVFEPLAKETEKVFIVPFGKIKPF